MSARKLLATLAVALPLLTAQVARADTKFGYVDLQRALQEVDEGHNAKTRLQSLLEGKQKEIDKEQEGLRKEKDLLEKQASAMSEETRNQKQTELQKKIMELAQKWEGGKREMQQKENDELQTIFRKMDPIIANIATREGFTMVFDKTNSGLVFAPASLDLTNELVRLYNDQYKVKGGVAKASAKKSDVPKKDGK